METLCKVSFFEFFQGFFEEIECTASMSFWLYECNSFSSCLVAFFMACWLLSLGFHPSVLSLLMSGSMFLTSPFQPLPPSTPPVNLKLTFLSFVSFVTISAMVLTSI